MGTAADIRTPADSEQALSWLSVKAKKFKCGARGAYLLVRRLLFAGMSGVGGFFPQVYNKIL